MAGTGWNCTLATVSCTRSDVLAAGALYPAITLTVNVSPTAQPGVFNSATVTGAGEVNTFNDTTSDSTVIAQLGDLTVVSTHSGSFSQGQTGASYVLAVSNASLGPTTGSVTVMDMLPVGQTATGIAGAGWSCVLGNLSCTRSDALAAEPGTSYPPIVLTVNGATTAATSVTNVATVSGGGEVNTAKDTSSDLTTITVPAPDLIISAAHSGNFTQGQTGATYSLTVTNIGPLASNGTVTVVDQVPSYLIATAMAGSGWNCTLSNVTCTRSDGLAAGPETSYPPIRLTVTVSSVATPSIANPATGSGGGELDTTNDAASDPTTINPWPDMVLIMRDSAGGTFSQGQTGASYILTAVNNGAAPSVGTVRVTDTLPARLTCDRHERAGVDLRPGNS